MWMASFASCSMQCERRPGSLMTNILLVSLLPTRYPSSVYNVIWVAAELRAIDEEHFVQDSHQCVHSVTMSLSVRLQTGPVGITELFWHIETGLCLFYITPGLKGLFQERQPDLFNFLFLNFGFGSWLCCYQMSNPRQMISLLWSFYKAWVMLPLRYSLVSRTKLGNIQAFLKYWKVIQW